MDTPRKSLGDLPAPQQAGILGSDPRFAQFIASAHNFPGDPACFIRGWCDVASRKELATDPAARSRFDALRTEFDVWTGKLPPQR